jgi:hypothetical protein
MAGLFDGRRHECVKERRPRPPVDPVGWATVPSPSRADGQAAESEVFVIARRPAMRVYTRGWRRSDRDPRQESE